MKKPVIIGIVLVILLAVTGMAVMAVVNKPKTLTKPTTVTEEVDESVGPADPSIAVKVVPSKVKDNAVVVTASGLTGKAKELEYEISYESAGQIKGATTDKPLPVSGDTFEREIYLGTCSRNVCTPDKGVTKVSIVMKFIAPDGKKTRFTGDFELK